MSAEDPRTVEDGLRWLRSRHVQPLEGLPAGEAEAQLAAEVQRCFATFPRVLQLILDLSLFRPPVDHNLQGDAYLRYAERRRGQDQLAASLLHYLDLAQQLQGGGPHERSPEPDAGPGPSARPRSRAAGRDGGADHGIGDWSAPGVAVR